jgi:hypothetical protein
VTTIDWAIPEWTKTSGVRISDPKIRAFFTVVCCAERVSEREVPIQIDLTFSDVSITQNVIVRAEIVSSKLEGCESDEKRVLLEIGCTLTVSLSFTKFQEQLTAEEGFILEQKASYRKCLHEWNDRQRHWRLHPVREIPGIADTLRRHKQHKITFAESDPQAHGPPKFIERPLFQQSNRVLRNTFRLKNSAGVHRTTPRFGWYRNRCNDVMTSTPR